jgi:hypothetical protein
MVSYPSIVSVQSNLRGRSKARKIKHIADSTEGEDADCGDVEIKIEFSTFSWVTVSAADTGARASISTTRRKELRTEIDA